MFAYNYTKSTVDVDTLVNEIEASGILSAVLQYINFNAPNSLDIYFDVELSSQDETTLDTVVSEHTGQRVFEDSGLILVSDGQGRLEYNSINSTSSGIVNHSDLINLDEDDHPQYHDDARGDTRYYTQTQVDTISGSLSSQISSVTPTFGTWYAWGGDESLTATNCTFPILKTSISVNEVPSGYYRVAWYYEWRKNKTSADYKASIKVNNTVVMLHNQESKDKNCWYNNSGFYNGYLSSGDHIISFHHWSENIQSTSYTRRARLEIWRAA